MNAIDIILLVLILLFAILGYYRGLVLMVGGLVVAVGAGIIAGQLSVIIADTIVPQSGYGANWLYNMIFWVIFIVIFALGNIILKMFDFLTNLPIVDSLKHWGGLVLGLIQGLLVAGFIAVMLGQFPLGHNVTSLVEDSTIVKITAFLSSIVTIFWPCDLREFAKLLRQS